MIFVVDTSGSMGQPFDDARRIDAAVECVNAGIWRLRAVSRPLRVRVLTSVVGFAGEVTDFLDGFVDVERYPEFEVPATGGPSDPRPAFERIASMSEPVGRALLLVVISDGEWDLADVTEPREPTAVIDLGPSAAAAARLATPWPRERGFPEVRTRRWDIDAMYAGTTTREEGVEAVEQLVNWNVAGHRRVQAESGTDATILRLIASAARVQEPASVEELLALNEPYFAAVEAAFGPNEAERGRWILTQTATDSQVGDTGFAVARLARDGRG